MPKYEIAKQFNVFDWIYSARDKGYDKSQEFGDDKCQGFTNDLRWYLDTYRDMSLPIVMDDALAARLVKSPHMASHWLEVGFIREAGIEWKLEDMAGVFACYRIVGRWIFKPIPKAGSR